MEGIILIKPQFEAMRRELEKGVVRRKEDHKNILKRVINSLHHSGASIKGITHSPIKGPAGNIEFFLYFAAGDHKSGHLPFDALDGITNNVVEESHIKLNI